MNYVIIAQGAWQYVKPRFDTALRELRTMQPPDETHRTHPHTPRVDVNPRCFRYVGRKPAASAATGSYRIHVAEMKDIIDSALLGNNANDAAAIRRIHNTVTATAVDDDDVK